MTGSLDSPVVIDSYGWIEYFSDGPLAGKYAGYIEASNPEVSFTPSIVVYEVYKKIRAGYSEESAMMAIAHIEHCTTLVAIDVSAALYGAEASLSESLPMADALIRAVARAKKATIVTSDPHFKGKEGVTFIERGGK